MTTTKMKPMSDLADELKDRHSLACRRKETLLEERREAMGLFSVRISEAERDAGELERAIRALDPEWEPMWLVGAHSPASEPKASGQGQPQTDAGSAPEGGGEALTSKQLGEVGGDFPITANRSGGLYPIAPGDVQPDPAPPVEHKIGEV